MLLLVHLALQEGHHRRILRVPNRLEPCSGQTGLNRKIKGVLIKGVLEILPAFSNASSGTSALIALTWERAISGHLESEKCLSDDASCEVGP